MITCRSCGLIDSYTTEQKGNNLVATCICGAYIQNIPTDKPRFYVGKYRGKAFDEIDDLSYLEWALGNMNSLNRRSQDAIKEQISRLKMLLK